MKYIILFSFVLKGILLVNAQCNKINIYLHSQEQVDSFNVSYPNCTEIYSLEIDDKIGPIKNLDSLINIKKIYSLRILKIDSLFDISGLNNLNQLNEFTFYHQRKYANALKIDSIGSIRHFFLNDTLDLSIYSNIKHINDFISINLSGKLTGLNDYTTDPKFSIFINDNKVKNDCKKLLPQSSTTLEYFSVKRCVELSLKGMEKITSINNIAFEDNQNCDFSSINEIYNCNELFIISQPTLTNIYPYFINLDTLYWLSLRMPAIEKLDDILPSLKHIRGFLILSGCSSLKNLSFFQNFSLPNEKISDLYSFRLTIYDNENLDSCRNDFICKALSTYPDSVWLVNNGSFCTKNELINQCTSMASNDNFNYFKIYPNPTFGQIFFDGLHGESKIRIRNINGQIIATLKNINNGADLSELTSGMYILEIDSQSYKERHKLIKME